MHSVPGGPWSGERNLAPGVDQHIASTYHLNEPIWQQYGRWVFDFVTGDFGPSFKYADRSINQMIVEQVDLIDVQKATIGLRQQAWLEAPLALGQRMLQIERADHAIF